MGSTPTGSIGLDVPATTTGTFGYFNGEVENLGHFVVCQIRAEIDLARVREDHTHACTCAVEDLLAGYITSPYLNYCHDPYLLLWFIPRMGDGCDYFTRRARSQIGPVQARRRRILCGLDAPQTRMVTTHRGNGVRI